jgi:hypothetical protein
MHLATAIGTTPPSTSRLGESTSSSWRLARPPSQPHALTKHLTAVGPLHRRRQPRQRRHSRPWHTACIGQLLRLGFFGSRTIMEMRPFWPVTWLGLLAHEDEALGHFSAQHYASFIFFQIHLFVKYSRNSYKLFKFVENHRNLRKIQSKFLYNLYEQGYTLE